MAGYLPDLLTLRPLSEPLRFEAAPAGERFVRAFGGRTLAQAVMAAGATAPEGRSLHSLHAYFLRPGNSAEAMECQVTVLRDGRAFSARRVEAFQRNALIFEMLASFHTGEAGPEHQASMPTVAGPEELRSFETRFAGRHGEDDMARWFFRANPFDVRYVDTSPFEDAPAEGEAVQQLWFRARELPDDQLVHAGAFAYASDMTILDPVLLRHGLRWTDRSMLGATLDHSIHFHRPIDFHQWHLFDQRSSVGHDGRVLASAEIWRRDGAHIATVQQEALMRPM